MTSDLKENQRDLNCRVCHNATNIKTCKSWCLGGYTAVAYVTMYLNPTSPRVQLDPDLQAVAELRVWTTTMAKQ